MNPDVDVEEVRDALTSNLTRFYSAYRQHNPVVSSRATKRKRLTRSEKKKRRKMAKASRRRGRRKR